MVVYNVGTNDHPIGEANVKVDDNSYHLVRFVRSGPNSTLQVDDNSMQTHYPSGEYVGRQLYPTGATTPKTIHE